MEDHELSQTADEDMHCFFREVRSNIVFFFSPEIDILEQIFLRRKVLAVFSMRCLRLVSPYLVIFAEFEC